MTYYLLFRRNYELIVIYNTNQLYKILILIITILFTHTIRTLLYIIITQVKKTLHEKKHVFFLNVFLVGHTETEKKMHAFFFVFRHFWWVTPRQNIKKNCV